MSPAAARLLLLSGRRAYGRLAGIVAGVAVGVAMMLILLAAFLHIPERDARAAWLSPVGAWAEGATPTDSQLLSAATVDVYDGRTIDVLHLALTPDSTVRMPAGLEPPGPGEFYASGAVAAMIEAAPADQLGERWGTLLGELPDTMLRGPSQRAVLAGADPTALAAWPQARLDDQFRSTGVNADSTTFRIVVAMGAIALLVPLVLLISIVAALGAAERRERLATVRLIGAGRRAVATLSGAELGLASLAGAALGVGLSAALRPLAAQLQISGSTLYLADLTTPVAWTLGVVLGIGVLGGATAYWRAYRDDVGALGATRARAERPVTARRVILLTCGAALFGASTAAIRWIPGSAQWAQLGVLAGFALIAFGIVVMGPWITRVASAGLGARTSSAAGLVAAGRLQRHPRATFRSVAGLVVAVFVVSVFAGGSSAITLASTPQESPGQLALDTVIAHLDGPADAAALEASVGQIAGVERVVVGRRTPDGSQTGTVLAADDARAIGAVEVPDADLVAVDLFTMTSDMALGDDVTPGVATAVDGDLAGFEPSVLLVLTDGDQGTIERVRTAVIAGAQPSYAPATRVDIATRGTADVNNELAVMAYLGMGIAIAISALALSVASVAAMLDRRRTFGLLRLGGMPVAQLRRTIVTEAAVPLGVTLLLSALLGFAVAWAVIEALSDDLSAGWPDPRYWGALAVSLAVAAAGIVGTFAAVRRSTEVESTRFE